MSALHETLVIQKAEYAKTLVDLRKAERSPVTADDWLVIYYHAERMASAARHVALTVKQIENEKAGKIT